MHGAVVEAGAGPRLRVLEAPGEEHYRSEDGGNHPREGRGF